MVDNQYVVELNRILLSFLIDKMFRNSLLLQAHCGGVDAVAGSAERLTEKVFVPEGGGVGEVGAEQVAINGVVIVVAAEAAHHCVDIIFRQVVLLEESVHEGTLLFGVAGVEKAGVDDAAEAVGGAGVSKEERYGCAAGDGAGHAGLFQRFGVSGAGTPVADLGKHLEVGGRHLVVAADEGGGDALELELHDGIEQRAVEGGAAVRVGAVVAVALQLEGDLRTDGVVGALHERCRR